VIAESPFEGDKLLSGGVYSLMAEAASSNRIPRRLRARWGANTWTAENAEKAKEIVARYPEGRQRSAVMPLLDLASGRSARN
jgi:NADH-quinone oxidoreductase subunit E